MMASDGAALSYSVASVVEDVLLQQQGIRRHIDLDCRRAEEAALRRKEAAGWLRHMVGVVASRDLPGEPSEEEFRLGLRSGIILCNALNKVQPGAVPKVVEGPSDSALTQDGAALSAYQYFENARNFLVSIQELGIPTFEASDLEQGGNIARVVNCVLALKSFNEWKQAGGTGVWKFGGNVKQPSSSAKSFVRKNFSPFMNSLSRNSSTNDKPLSPSTSGLDSTKVAGSLSMLVQTILSDKKPEEVPALVESLLNKLVEEFEKRMANQLELTKSSTMEVAPYAGNNALLEPTSTDRKSEEKNTKSSLTKGMSITKSKISVEESKGFLLKQQMLFDEQQGAIDEIKSTLYNTKSGMQVMQMKFDEEFNNLGNHIQGLSMAASAYHRVLEENRKLYNQVQDLKGSIRVYCRVRPFLPGQISETTTVENIEEGSITISTPSKYGTGHRSFIFNKVFGSSSSQEEVFSDTRPLIRSVLDGYNVCIFAYGQTGSGKTYTMTGPKQLTEDSHGVNYRALSDLFVLVEQRKDTFRYDIAVQMIEIYNEQVRDLLVSDGTNKRLEIRNSSQNGLNVPGASLVPVSSTPDVLDLMNVGQRNRAVGATALNDRSSRSHSCLTVHVQGRDLTSGAVLRGCMHLVDLAGSERVDKSEAVGDRLKEAQHINKSLSALGDVIYALAQRNPHVPYRNSKLTQLLQDSLGGQAKTLMFVHISPEPSAVGETISTLKFAERVSTVELGAAQVNKDGADVKELKEQIASLKAALAMKEEQPKHQTPSTVPINSERRRRKATDLPSFSSIPLNLDALSGQDSIRQPMGDVGNIEQISCASLPKQKKQSIDIHEPSGNSPPWPPIPCQNYIEEDKGVGNRDWEDKIMVNNKQGEAWEPENDNLTDVFYLKDSTKFYPEQTYNNTFPITEINLDASTSDSETDLLYQLNHTKLNGSSTGIGSGVKKTVSRPVKATNSRNLSSVQAPSPSRKALNGGGLPLHRSARVQLPDSKRKHTTNRK